MTLPTVTVKAHSSSAKLESFGTTWIAARDGYSSSIIKDGTAFVGNSTFGQSSFRAYQSFLWFDIASVLPKGSEIKGAKLKIRAKANEHNDLNPLHYVYVLMYDWGSTLTTSDWRTAAKLGTYDKPVFQVANSASLTSLKDMSDDINRTNDLYTYCDPVDGLRCMMALWDENWTVITPLSTNWINFYLNNNGGGFDMELEVSYTQISGHLIGQDF